MLPSLLHHYYYSGGGEVFSEQYQAVLDYANTQIISGDNEYELPNIWDQIQEDLAVRSLILSEAWDTFDQIINLSAAGGKKFALINIKNPGVRNASLEGTTISWVKGMYFSCSGTSYLRTNFIPAIHGENYKQNDAGIMFSVANNVAGSTTAIDFGANDASNGNAIHASIRNTSDNTVSRVNSNSAFSISNSNTKGRYIWSRESSVITKLFKNGSQIGSTSNTASTGLTSKEIYLGANNNNGSASGFSTKQLDFWSIGSNLEAHALGYTTTLSTLKNGSLTINIPSFPDKTSITNYLASVGQLRSAFSYGAPAQEKITVSASDYYGGVIATNNFIYCAPGADTVALKINTTDRSVSTFGAFSVGTFKYGGAVFANGSVYFIPASSTVVAKVDISTDAVTFFDTSGVKGSDSGNLGATTQKWYGGYIGQDGRIYCIPYNATVVMIIDPTNDTIQFLDTTGIVSGVNGNLTGLAKWDTGVAYGNVIYGSPSDATDILKINTSVPSCQRLGSFPVGTAKWAITSVSTVAPYVYFFPYFSTNVIKYDTSNDTYTYLDFTIPSIGGGSTIKVIGASITPTGEILLILQNAVYTSNYLLDPVTDTVKSFLRESLTASNGAVLANDGSVYAIPSSTATVLQRFFYPRREISLPENFIINNFIIGY